MAGEGCERSHTDGQTRSCSGSPASQSTEVTLVGKAKGSLTSCVCMLEMSVWSNIEVAGKWNMDTVLPRKFPACVWCVLRMKKVGRNKPRVPSSVPVMGGFPTNTQPSLNAGYCSRPVGSKCPGLWSGAWGPR